MNGLRRFIIMTIISCVTVLRLRKLRQHYESHGCFDSMFGCPEIPKFFFGFFFFFLVAMKQERQLVRIFLVYHVLMNEIVWVCWIGILDWDRNCWDGIKGWERQHCNLVRDCIS